MGGFDFLPNNFAPLGAARHKLMKFKLINLGTEEAV